MKRFVRWAARLYPAEWRMRYGAEFDVLLDDAPLRWSDLGDVVRGAAIMQMTSWMTYWKMALLAGIAGAMLAGGIAFAIPDQYLCYASMALEKSPVTTPWQLSDALQKANAKILGRDGFLKALVLDPQLDLYKKERQTLSADRVAEDIFRKHLYVRPYDMGHGSEGQAFSIVFQYPDRYKAAQVVRRLTVAYQQEFPPTPGGPVLRVLEAPLTPLLPFYPNRLAMVTAGLIAGMLTGLLSLKIWRRTRDYAVVTMSLPQDTKKFVDRQVASGHFGSVSAYVRELIRAEEQREAHR